MYTTSIILPSQTQEDCTRKIPFFKQSMFFKFPPTINFPLPNEYIENIPATIATQLKWRPSTITPQVIKSCIAKAGFRLSEKFYFVVGGNLKNMDCLKNGIFLVQSSCV